MSGRPLSIRRTQRPDNGSLPPPVDAPVCQPYLSISKLATLTPWTDQAIRTMVSRGVLREGEHFFHVGRRPVFKWAAIVGFIIEQGPPHERVLHYREQLNLWGESAKSAVEPVRSK